MAAQGTREDQFIVTCSVTDPITGETRNLGVFDKQTGGGLDSEESTYKASGGRRLSLGGSQTPDNLVISRNYDLVRDHSNVGWLLALVGRGSGVVVKQPTNGGYVAVGGPITWDDLTLKRCTPPEVDSEGTGAALIELEFTVGGPPKA